METKTVGIVLGCFCPLHQGHLDLIMRAKKENDLCYIVVCGYKGDRGGDLLPLEKRYRYVCQEFANDENVKIIKVNDDELGLDQSFSLSNWKIWLNDVYKKLDRDYLSNLVWYVSEPQYAEVLEYYNERVVYENRALNPISGTMIRENPIKYWNKIAPSFRKVFSQNILIVGTASEGKTTLTQDIGRYFGIPYSVEMGRTRMEETTKTDCELDFGDFHYNIYEQNKLNAQLIDNHNNRGVIISDTDNLVTLMYAKKYAEEENFKLSMDDYQVLKDIVKKQSKYVKWKKVFVLAPQDNYVDDGIRYMGHSDKETREKLFNHLIELLDEFGYNYEILKGNYYLRFLKVKEYIGGLLND